MSRKLKIGVVGAGVFGRYHIGKCAAHSDVDLIGVFDHRYSSAVKAAKECATKAYAQFSDLLTDIDAVIIASPARSHGALSIQALEAGVHCLIEKPIAARAKEAAQIVELAKANKCTVQIGHQERFVAKAIGLDKIPEVPLSITAFRMSPYSERGTDVSVTLDLMTHDLDLLTLLIGERPKTVKGVPISVKSNFADASLGLITFPSGTIAKLHASRVEAGFRRTMDITYPSGTVSIDFNAKTLTHDTPFDLDTNFASNPLASDSLGAATNTFVAAILNDKPVPITAEDGYRALEMALAIDGENTWDVKDV